MRRSIHILRRPARVAVLLLMVACNLFGATVINAQDETKDFFREKCASCHSIGGGPRTGPDLKGVTERRSTEWLERFIKDPKAVIASGDPDAVTLDSKYPAVMPNNLGVTDDRAKYLIGMIAKESKLKNSEFGVVVLDPFQPGDIDRGKEIFLGNKPLKNRGVACVSCHAMHDTPSLGGGRLGPDLTNVFERLKGRESLESWLRSPNTETMGPIFAGDDKKMDDDEIRQLAAYFEASAGESPVDPSANRVAFLLIGLILATAIVFAFDAIWKRRFHSVRQPLVDSTPVRGQP